MAAPFNALSQMVLSHASEEGAGEEVKAAKKNLVDSLKTMLSKPKAAAAA
jgi:hypothetical protein